MHTTDRSVSDRKDCHGELYMNGSSLYRIHLSNIECVAEKIDGDGGTLWLPKMIIRV